MAHKLPPLRFWYDALEPYPELAELAVEDVLARLDTVPEPIRVAVRNNGGGHANHQLFWDSIDRGAGGTPKGAIAGAITRDFGSFEQFQALFSGAAAKHFGSGWAFLVLDASARLQIVSLPDQDTPLLQGTPPVLCCDVWEHAYYLRYRNRRADYLTAWWNVVAWDVVDERLRDILAGAR